MKNSGYKRFMGESKCNLLKWREYMKRAQLAERKVAKLKRLILLTDPSVSDVEVTDIAVKQFNEYLREFPDDQ